MKCWRKLLLGPAERLRGEKELRRKIQNVEALRDLFLFERGEAVRILRIGTRGSMLAKWQAESVRKKLFAATGMEAENRHHQDQRRQDAASAADADAAREFLSKSWRRRCWRKTIDLAVHSVKDVPTDIPSRLMFPRCAGAMMCVIAWLAPRWANLRQGARVGTSRLRRQAQLKHLRRTSIYAEPAGKRRHAIEKSGERGI